LENEATAISQRLHPSLAEKMNQNQYSASKVFRRDTYQDALTQIGAVSGFTAGTCNSTTDRDKEEDR